MFQGDTFALKQRDQLLHRGATMSPSQVSIIDPVWQQ